MVPVLKKTTLEPGCAVVNYRPITISVTLCKTLDLHILDRCKDHALSDTQFGFVHGHGTDMATAVAHDVGVYCMAKGSSAFYASLDAEGAFDFLRHCVILEKCADVLSNNLWLLFQYAFTN